MFKNTFESKIKDEETLFSMLMQQVERSVKDCIQACIFSNLTNRYTMAMKKLRKHVGSKLSVLIVHKQRLYAGGEIRDDINGYSNLINNLSGFEVVTIYYSENRDRCYTEELIVRLLKKKVVL